MVNRNKMSMPERLKKFENLEPGLPMTGKINLNNPEVLLVLLERYPPCKNNQKKKPEEMDHVFLSRFIIGGQRKLIQDYAVTNRIAVGNTSMDAELALWMSNIAKIDSSQGFQARKIPCFVWFGWVQFRKISKPSFLA